MRDFAPDPTNASIGRRPTMASASDETKKAPEEPAVKSGELPTNDSARPFPVVGIGASAGGLEALRELLRHLPDDTGMGFVLIQHLDPSHESALTELLSRGTKLPVAQVTQGMQVEPNHLYIIPPNANMEIRDGTLQLSPRTQTRGLHMPVDCFLRSLAGERGSQAIAVILSGSASDGALGLNEVKAAGGITFAQDETAKYDGMPRSAVATGHVDFVLPPKKIADELLRIGKHPYLSRRRIQKDEEMPGEIQDEFLNIFVLLRGAKGVDFSLYKHGTLSRRIGRRMALHKIQRLEDYVRHLGENASEVEALFEDILIHVTGFFRDPEAFATLQTVVFPALMADRSPDDSLRIWVPGCSTGEEVYSIAISLLEFLGDKASSTPITLFATDISDKAIETARAGLYPENIRGDVSPERLRRFFMKVTDGYEVNKTIRETCIFAKQDLTKDPPFSNLDLISCRNVLIYFGPVLQKKILPIFHYSLKSTGFLMLGSSEAVGPFSDLFELKEKEHRTYSKKPTTAPGVFDFPLNDGSTIEMLGGEKKGESPPGGFLNKEVDRLMLEEYSPPGVIINEDLRIVQVRGETGPYLQLAPGLMSADVLKMAREGLRLALQEATEEAKQSGRVAKREGLRAKTNDHHAKTNLRVFPLRAQDGEGKCFLVLFERASTPPQPERRRTEEGLLSRLRSLFRPPGAPARAKASAESVQIAQLRLELDETKGYLRSLVQEQDASNEELRAANEETLSANEELLSTNEELETAKEELQATNEELGTVNEELQNRNVDMSKLNDDLRNLLGSIEIPIIMLGNDLRIRRFTPTAATVLNLIPSDVGRPIGDLKPKINVPDLETMIEEVVETFLVSEREVHDQGGHWYHMHVRPYRTLDRKVDGAVITLADIDHLKQTEQTLRDEGEVTDEKLHRSEARERSIVESAAEGIVTFDRRGMVESFNPAAQRMFGYETSEVIGKNIEALIPSLDQEERDGNIANHPRTGEKKIVVSSREVEGLRKDGTSFPLDLSTSEIHNGENRGFTAILRDITERKRAESALRRMSQVFMDSADPIVIMDLSGETTDLNAEAERAYGWTRQEMIGKPVKMMVPQERHQQVDELLDRCRQGEIVRNVEGLRLSKSGKVVPILFTLSLLTNEAGEGIGIANIAKDMTELKRAERRLMQSERLAAIGEAMTGLTHESRNLLARSRAEVRMLGRRLKDHPSLLEFLERLETTQGDLHRLFEAVRQYAAPVKLNREPCHLGELLREAWKQLTALREGENAQLQELSGELDLLCEVDKFAIQQVFRNLLENSLTACADPVRIEVEYSEGQIGGQPSIRMAIRDNGPGLPAAEEAERIFDAFYTTKTHGTGLGLAICRRIVNEHGGKIALGPGDGQGAVFLLTLPKRHV